MDEVREAVERLRKRLPGIEAVYLFGSVASGVPTPRSDVDLLVVAAGIDRETLHAELATICLPVDCHLMSPAGFARQTAAGRGVAGAAVRRGIRLV